ncbi:E3 ubiquitin-protein ligase TRIM11-like [Lissotriton helveticus]
MATAAQLQALRDEATCSVCLSLFRDPVALECGHHFCRPCITHSWWERQGSPCPECRAVVPGGLLRPNRQLENIVEMLRGLPEPDRHLCGAHGEKLLLFGTTDRTPICVVCDRSREHRGHVAVPVQEAAEEHRVPLKNMLPNLKSTLSTLQNWKSEKEATSAEWEGIFRSQHLKILLPFIDLEQFLEKEKGSLLTHLVKEHQATLKKNQGKVAALEKQQNFFTTLLTEIEERCLLPDIDFLKVAQNSIARTQNLTICKPEDDAAEREHTVKRFCSQHSYLMERVKKIKETFLAELEFYEHVKCFECPVTLDPGTANRHLIVSADGRSVSYGGTAQDLSYNPQAFEFFPFVLGRQRLNSGRHYWEVRVGDKTRWSLGVCDESVRRKSEETASLDQGYWMVSLLDGAYLASTAPLWTTLRPCQPLRAVGIFVDYEAGKLLMYNVQDRSLLFTFSGCSFPPVLCPFFCPWNQDKGKNVAALCILSMTQPV